jgi:protein-S-isoprenylcysteine O-methyltransferase Ste14
MASLFAALIILALVTIFFQIASLISKGLHFPDSLNFPVLVQTLGIVLIAGGAGLATWLFRYRRPAAMLVSTYATFLKLFTRRPIEQLSGRAEPLIVSGPQKYIRHPLYLGAVSIFLGWGIVTGTVSGLIGTLFILLWFRFVQIPFEEKEMRAIFGEQYVKYMHNTSMFIPFPGHHRGT